MNIIEVILFYSKSVFTKEINSSASLAFHFLFISAWIVFIASSELNASLYGRFSINAKYESIINIICDSIGISSPEIFPG